MCWEAEVPARAFDPSNKKGVIMEVPLTVAAYAETVNMEANESGGVSSMDTCWKAVSRVRLLAVMHRCIVGGKGLETNSEVPTLIVSRAWAGRRVCDLKFSCPHGTMTTRLLGAHCALRATIMLSESRNAMHLPEVQALIESLSFMTVCFRAISAEERTVLALGLGLSQRCQLAVGRNGTEVDWLH